MDAERMVVTLVVGSLGSWVARRMRIPGGGLIGAMVATGILSLTMAESEPLPYGVRAVSLVLLGTYAGSGLQRDSLRLVRPVLPAAFGAILALITVGCALGMVLHRYVAPDLAVGTLVLGTMPGGASGLTAIAGDVGGEFALVGAMHMVRLIVVFGLLPLVLARLARAAKP